MLTANPLHSADRVCDGADLGDDQMGHGTHVGGTIAGNAGHADFVEHNGIAPQAKLSFDDIGSNDGTLGGVPNDLYTDLFPHSYAIGAKLHSNSWGASANIYEIMSSEIDRFTYEHDDFLILFAAGNDGPGPGTLGAPAGAKNILSIGAGENDFASYPGNPDDKDFHNLVDFSSRGPTPDGRFKPDVVCPGENIISADSDGDLRTYQCRAGVAAGLEEMSGTSMATPGCAGGAALVRQYFEEGFHGSGANDPAMAMQPTAALVKAVMIQSGQPMWYDEGSDKVFPPKLPHPSQGYGRVDLSTVLWFGAESNFNARYFNNETVQPEGQTCYGFAVANGSQFKVSLVWMDKEGDPAAPGKVLVQDLDLVVTTPSGELITGNHLDGGLDRVNNNEQVTVVSAEIGVYSVFVKAHDLPMGAQRFALVVTGDVVDAPCASCTNTSCSGNGGCIFGSKCKCNPGFSGADCSTQLSPLISPACSSALPDGIVSGSELPPTISSSTDMGVEFTSDSSFGGPGFRAVYSQGGRNVWEDSCGVRRPGIVSAEDALGFISTGGQYSNNARCKWQIAPKGATSITLVTDYFSTEGYYDKVRIEECRNRRCSRRRDIPGSPFSGSFPSRLTRNTNKLIVTFTSDGSVVAPGFRLLYTSSANVHTCQPGSLVTVPPGIGLLEMGPYHDSTQCAFHLESKVRRNGNLWGVDLSFMSLGTEENVDVINVTQVSRDCLGTIV